VIGRIQMPRKPKKIPQIISEEEFKRVLNVILFKKKSQRGVIKKLYYFNKIRKAMIFFLMYYLGLRPKESFASKVEHVNLNNGTLYIPAENNKQRVSDMIPLPDFVIDALNKYLRIRRYYFKNSPYLFPSKHRRSSGILGRSMVCRIFKEACKKAGIIQTQYTDVLGRKKYNLTPYSLRHAFASKVYFKTKDIKKTALMLRQYDWQCRSTLRYVHTAENMSKREIYNSLYSNPF